MKDAADKLARVARGVVVAGQVLRSTCRRPRLLQPLPTISAEVTGPGPIFESLMELKPGDDMAHFKYQAKEYFVSGTANGQPYKTRIVIRRPADNAKFSGLVLAESMHPSGNAWMFHFTHRYSMDAGHIGARHPDEHARAVRRVQCRALQGLCRWRRDRRREIIAQVGALMKSKQPGTRWPRCRSGR